MLFPKTGAARFVRHLFRKRESFFLPMREFFLALEEKLCYKQEKRSGLERMGGQHEF